MSGAGVAPSCAVLLRASSIGRRPMFCFHGAGGTVLFFMPVARRLALLGPVYGVQCRGVDADVEPDRSMARMAERYVRDVVAANGQYPFRLSGFSLGGVIAHEVACRLIERGREVESLTLIDTLYPRSPINRPPGETLELISIVLRFPVLFVKQSD